MTKLERWVLNNTGTPLKDHLVTVIEKGLSTRKAAEQLNISATAVRDYAALYGLTFISLKRPSAWRQLNFRSRGAI